MKSFLSIVILSVLLISCGGDTKTAETTAVNKPFSDSLSKSSVLTADTVKVNPSADNATAETPEAAPERIVITKESPAIVWEQKVKAKSSKEFVFKAQKGQLLMLNFIDDTNIGAMDFGKYSVDPDGLEMMIEATKDYTFSVTNNSNKSTSFRISMVLETPKKKGK